MPEFHRETWLAHDPEANGVHAVVPPLHQTSLFTFDSYEEMLDAVTGKSDRYIYSRGLNPTVRVFEEKVAQLEGAEDGRAFASGMAAICAAVLSQVQAGDRVVCIRNVYPDVYKLFTQWLPRFGVTTEFVDGGDTAAVIEKLEGARVLYLENPSSLVFGLQDVGALTAAARERGVITILDNSWATPLYQQPLTHGVDIVIHSASKYLSGHSDVVAGIVLGAEATIARVTRLELPVLGAKLSPFEGWLLLRGLRTLSVRLERHGRSAQTVATYLRSHPAVARVHFPELLDHPQHELFARYFAGSSGLLSFELTEIDEAAVRTFVNSLEVFRLGVSWGGYESLVYPAVIGHAAGGPTNALRDFEISKGLIRLHVGLEHPSDLLADLGRALTALKGGSVRI